MLGSSSNGSDDEEITYQQLESFDYINVDLVPERKGLILKHSEYAVTSRRHGTTVIRRYSDFVQLHDILLAKYPYRAVCRLPPKRVTVGGGSPVFLERRRAALQRWLTLTATHPVLAHDADTRAFLCEANPPTQQPHKDEFQLASSELTQAECITDEMTAAFKSEHEQLGLLYLGLNRLNQIFTHAEQRCEAERGCVQELGSVLASLSAPRPSAAADCSPAWLSVRRALAKAAVAARCEDMVYSGCDGWNQLRLAQDALAAHRDLCNRLTRGAHAERARAAKSTSPSQVGAASMLRARHCYALACAAAEARLTRAYALAALETLPDLMQTNALALARSAALWAELRKAITGKTS